MNLTFNDNLSTKGLTTQNAALLFDEFFVKYVYDWYVKVKPGDVVVDIGACVGFFTASSLDLGAKKVYMVEPNKELLKVACQNVLPHTWNKKESPIVPINALITNNEEIKTGFPLKKDAYKNGVWRTEEDTFDINEIPKLTFKQLIEEYQLDHIDFLKIDIEGSEYDIFIEENLDYIKNNISHIALEIHTRAFPNSYERFKNFRDNFLVHFKETHEIRTRPVDYAWNMYDDPWLLALPDWQSFWNLYITKK